LENPFKEASQLVSLWRSRKNWDYSVNSPQKIPCIVHLWRFSSIPRFRFQIMNAKNV